MHSFQEVFIFKQFGRGAFTTPLEKNYQVGYIVDKDRASLTKIKNLHETGQIISYRPENHRFRLEILRPETWYY